MEPLGDVVGLVMINSFSRDSAGRMLEYNNPEISSSELKNLFIQCKDFLLNDGCTKVVVYRANQNLEVCLDQDKTLLLSGNCVADFKRILGSDKNQVNCVPELRLISEGGLITAGYKFLGQFSELVEVLGLKPF